MIGSAKNPPQTHNQNQKQAQQKPRFPNIRIFLGIEVHKTTYKFRLSGRRQQQKSFPALNQKLIYNHRYEKKTVQVFFSWVA